MNSSRNQEEGIARIQGADISFMQFILNYLIIGFSEKGALTTLVWPRAITEENDYKFGQAGYRDVLCSFIGQEVLKSEIDSDVIDIRLPSNSRIVIDLKEFGPIGERAILTGPNHYLELL